MANMSREHWMGEFPTRQRQCEDKSLYARCNNEAKYVLAWGQDKTGEVCDACLPGWLHRLTERGPVAVERLR